MAESNPPDTAQQRSAEEEEAPRSIMERIHHLRGQAKLYVLRRRRERAAKKKANNSRLGLALTSALVILLMLFGWSLLYLFSSHVPGRQLTLDEVTVLAEQGRIDQATFLD